MGSHVYNSPIMELHTISHVLLFIGCGFFVRLIVRWACD